MLYSPTQHWVLIKKVVEVTGYTENAARAKVRKGVWVMGIHWKKAPDNRVIFDLNAIQKWMSH